MASLSKIWRDWRLLLTIKIRTYKALVLSTLLCAAETWTVHAGDDRIHESFHMKCQHQILSIRWQDHVRNVSVANHTCFPPVMDHFVIRRSSIFGHVVRMLCTVPVHRALCCQVVLSLGSFPDRSWKRLLSRSLKRWLGQIHDDSRCWSVNVWRDAVVRGHRGSVQWQQFLMTTCWQQWRVAMQSITRLEKLVSEINSRVLSGT